VVAGTVAALAILSLRLPKQIVQPANNSNNSEANVNQKPDIIEIFETTQNKLLLSLLTGCSVRIMGDPIKTFDSIMDPRK
jgi:hypothetical protein